MPEPDFDAWARETREPTADEAATQFATWLGAFEKHPRHSVRDLLDISYEDAPVYASGLRALLRERGELAEKLETWYREAQSLRAQRDSMEAALNKANAELHVITRCGETFESFFGAGMSKPCIRESAHPGSHCNADGTRWFFNAPDDATSEHAEQVMADLRAAREMFRRPEDRHFSPGYDGEKPDHHGPADTCAMPACVKRRAQHQAADRIQDLTAELFTNRDPE